MSGEFAMIERYFRPLAGPDGLGLIDDAALLTPPDGRALVLSADAMVAGVHFMPDDKPDLIARKLLRVNLSDLAAMGAAPLGYLLTISVPHGTGEPWFASFASGLAADQAAFGLSLLGGDTTATPGPLCLSLTIIGHVAAGAALRRAGACEGDELWVTGTIGDSALGLLALTGAIADPDRYLADRYRLPQPRLGLALAGIAHAGLDVSDGLVQDAGHLAAAAGLRVEIDASSVPLSAAARPYAASHRDEILAGGDDYELLLAVPPWTEAALIAAAGPVPVTRIGRFLPGMGVSVLDEAGGDVTPRRGGWQHF